MEELARESDQPTSCSEVGALFVGLTQEILDAWHEAGITYGDTLELSASDLEARIQDHVPSDYFERASLSTTAEASLGCTDAEMNSYFCDHATELEAKSSGAAFLLMTFIGDC